MSHGRDFKTTPSTHANSLIDIVDLSKPSHAGKGRFGPSTEFIVTPENMGGAGCENPDLARFEIVQKLHATCASRVYGFLRKSVSADIADDLTQETFLKLLQVKNLERKSISISYLFRIAQNLLRRRFNVSKRRREILEKVARFDRPLHEKTLSGPVGIEAFMLDEALESLTAHEQETIRLIICDGLSYTQAARVLGVPVSTINNWKHRALHKLKGTIDAADSQDSDSPEASSKRLPDHARSGREQASRAPETSDHHGQARGNPQGRSEARKSGIRFAG